MSSAEPRQTPLPLSPFSLQDRPSHSGTGGSARRLARRARARFAALNARSTGCAAVGVCRESTCIARFDRLTLERMQTNFVYKAMALLLLIPHRPREGL